jgi:hypothetical protein
MNKDTAGSSLLHLLILLLYGLVLTWPAISTGYIPSHDVLIHLLWSTNFTSQLWAGEWYPRWLDQMNNGLGSPVFFFYAPLPYYFTASLKPLFNVDPEGWRQIGVAASMAIILSGYSAYLWLRRSNGAPAALIAAIVYMGAPYHLAIDLYDRFAFAKLWAFVWMPLVLWGVEATIAGKRRAPLGLALAFAGLVLTHPPTTLIFSLVAIAYAILCGERGDRVRAIMRVGVAMALGAGIAGAYLVPALTTQQNVSFSDMRVDYLSYVYHFLYYGPRFNADLLKILAQLGNYAAVALMACAAAFLLAGRSLVGQEKQCARFWMGVAIAVFLMMLPIARPIWDLLPLLQAIQFPWRFNIVLTLAMAALVALWASAAITKASRLNGLSLALVCAIVIGQSLPAVYTYQMLSQTPGETSMDKVLVQLGPLNEKAVESVEVARLAVDVPEYRPRWVPSEFRRGSSTLHDALAQIQTAYLQQEQGTAAILSRSPRRMVVAVDIPTEGWVKLPHFYYPGWRAVDSATSARLSLRPSKQEGLIELKAGPGQHRVVLELEPGMAERVGWGISGLSMGLFALLAFRAFRPAESRCRIGPEPV